jgi:hypothetical protein
VSRDWAQSAGGKTKLCGDLARKRKGKLKVGRESEGSSERVKSG